MTCLCGEPVPSPYIRIAWGERGGAGNYREIFVCGTPCLSKAENIVDSMLESTPA